MKGMKKIFAIIVIASLGIFSCTNDFETINTNPNDPVSVSPEFLLRQVIYNLGEEMSYEGFVAGNLLGQHFSMVDFNLFDRHALTDPQLGGNPWPVLYQNLRDLELLLSSLDEMSQEAHYEGPARILKAYTMMILTDIYGDVPIFEAFKGNNGFSLPRYDSQEEIYSAQDGIKDNLSRGLEILKATNLSTTIEGDLLYNGNTDQWVKFGNSLLLKVLMRTSGVALDAVAIFELFSENNMITNSADNASFDFTDLPPNSFRMQQLRDGDFNLFVMSETMQEILNGLNDPRREILFRPSGNDGTFQGLLNGPDASNTSISVSNYSLPGTIFRDHTGDLDANFITAWEVEFLLAEAATLGYIFSNPQTHYENGIQLAFEYWGVDIPSDYLDEEAAFASSEEERIEQIITQKWIASSINGYEGWIEYRRTGYPVLKNVSASLNNNLIPRKMPYPAEEEALNFENFSEATSQNGNSVNVNVWWDN